MVITCIIAVLGGMNGYALRKCEPFWAGANAASCIVMFSMLLAKV